MSTLPRRFGDYMLMQRLARGGMGEIFLGQKPGQRRYVALKTLRQDLTRDEEYVTRFLDEARVAIVLNHPAINKVFDVGFADGTYYLELEYISGRDARSLTERARDLEKKIPQEVAYFIVTEMLSALSYLHEAKDITGAKLNLIHRDVSPQNLMISWEGQVTMIDFGLARFAARTTATEPGMVLGKLRYMAPEQAQGGDIDHRVDLFAAGVMMYELLSGRRLYEDVNPNELWTIVAKGQALQGVHLELVPAEAAPLIERALAIDPGQRFADAEVFLQQVQACQTVDRKQAKKQLVAVLADLFDVDLQLEREFMDKLGRMAPFEMHSGEMTQSVSLADPSALVEQAATSDIAPDLVAAAAAMAATNAEVSSTDRNEFAAPVATEDFEDEGVVSTPLLVEEAAAVAGEHTFLVDRSSESTAPDQPLVEAGAETMDSSAWFADSPREAFAPSRAGPDWPGRLRVWLADWRVAAAAAALGLALVALMASMIGGEGDASQGEDGALTTVNVSDAVEPAEPHRAPGGDGKALAAAAKPRPTKTAAALAVRSSRGKQKEPRPHPRPAARHNRPSRPDRAHARTALRDSAPPVQKRPSTSHTAAREPAHVAATVEAAPRNRLARNRKRGKAIRQALLHQVNERGISRIDIAAYWPEQWRRVQDNKLELSLRQQAADEIEARAAKLPIDKTFIRKKLNRVQKQCNSILPRLDANTKLFLGLKKKQEVVLRAFAHAGNDPAKLKEVNTLLNELSVGVALAK